MVLVDNLPWPPPRGQVGTGGLTLGHHSQPGHGVLWSGARTSHHLSPHLHFLVDGHRSRQPEDSLSKCTALGVTPPRTGHGREPSQSRHPRPQPCQRAAGAPRQALWTVCQVTYGTDLARAAGTRRPAAPSTQIGAVSANALSRRERSARQLSKHLQRGSCTGTE